MTRGSRLALIGLSGIAFYAIASYLLSPGSHTPLGLSTAVLAAVALLGLMVWLVVHRRREPT